MTKFPVHCCCTPCTRLGYVVVDNPRFLGEVRFVVRHDDVSIDREIVTEIATVGHLEARSDGDGEIKETRHSVRAVKSAHEPIEVWRRVEGFSEDAGLWP